MALEEGKVSLPTPQGVLPKPVGKAPQEFPAGAWRTRVLPQSCHREPGVPLELT